MSHNDTRTALHFIIISAQTHLHNLADGGVGEAMHHLSIHQNLAGIVVPDSSDL